jgi:hypothetical protein
VCRTLGGTWAWTPKRVEIYRLSDGRYGAPTILTRGGRLTSPLLSGFDVAACNAFGLRD